MGRAICERACVERGNVMSDNRKLVTRHAVFMTTRNNNEISYVLCQIRATTNSIIIRKKEHRAWYVPATHKSVA